MKRVHAFITGRVQGVTFRYNTRKKARKLGVNGWVKNLEDGRVEVVAEGEDEAVDELIKYCHKGPIFAKVKDVEVEEEEYEDEFKEFSIRY